MKQLLVAALSVLLVACSSGGSEPTSPNDESNKEFRTYTISLGMGGELSNVDYSPLTKSTSNDLYAIQVYSKLADSTDSYEPCAFGVFDSLEGMIITLDNEHTYNFEATMLVDGKMEKGHYFQLSSGWTSTVNKQFVVTHNTNLVDMQLGSAFLSDKSKVFNHPSFDRFYGVASDYTPANSETVTINMKRVSFGVKVVAEGLEEGVVYVDIDQCPTRLTIDSAQGNTASQIISFYHVGTCYTTGDEYSEVARVAVFWENAVGKRIPIVAKEITFKRNQMTTLTCTITAPNESDVLLTNTDEAMTDGDVIALN